MSEKIITLNEICKILNCHQNTHKKWNNNGYFKDIGFNKRGDYRYYPSDI